LKNAPNFYHIAEYLKLKIGYYCKLKLSTIQTVQQMKLTKSLILLMTLALFACKQSEEATLATTKQPTETQRQEKISSTQFLQTSFGKVAFIETGQGAATLLFIHGNSASKAVFKKQFDSNLADHYRLIAFDLPGHGESDNAEDPQSTYTIHSYAQLVGELVSKLDLKPLVLVGWSLGGHIAIEAAAQGLPLAGIVISGTPPVGPGVEHMGEAFIASESMGLTGKPEFTNEEVVAFANEGMGGAEFVNEEILKAIARTDGIARQTMLLDWSTPGAGHEHRQFVGQWPKPIAVLQGEQDAYINGEYLRSLKWNNLWRGEIQFFAGIGHAPFWQDAEQFNELLGDFLKDLGY